METRILTGRNSSTSHYGSLLITADIESFRYQRRPRHRQECGASSARRAAGATARACHRGSHSSVLTTCRFLSRDGRAVRSPAPTSQPMGRIQNFARTVGGASSEHPAAASVADRRGPGAAAFRAMRAATARRHSVRFPYFAQRRPCRRWAPDR